MDSFKDVLEAAQAYCKTQMAEPTYNLYIDGLEPISFEDSSHITLSVRNDFICKIVTDRYLGLLKEAFKTVLGFDVDITLVVPSTPPHEVVLAQQYEEMCIRDRVYLIELVVVTVVGGGELVENLEKPCRNAGRCV